LVLISVLIGAHLDTVPLFSLPFPKGGEGWGEEALGFPSQNLWFFLLARFGRKSASRTVLCAQVRLSPHFSYCTVNALLYPPASINRTEKYYAPHH
jgi:hypothetical protein